MKKVLLLLFCVELANSELKYNFDNLSFIEHPTKMKYKLTNWKTNETIFEHNYCDYSSKYEPTEYALSLALHKNIDLKWVDLRDVSLYGYYFHNLDISYANMSDTDIANAYFHNTTLKHINFNKTNLWCTKFDNSNLEGSDFSEAKFFNTSFKNTSVKDVILCKTNALLCTPDVLLSKADIFLGKTSTGKNIVAHSIFTPSQRMSKLYPSATFFNTNVGVVRRIHTENYLVDEIL